MTIANLPSIMGTVLILMGIAIVLLQMRTAMPEKPELGADFGLSRWKVKTEFPGIVMICVGALLLGVGAFAH